MSFVNVDLDRRHIEGLEELCIRQGMSKSTVMRQALRLYQEVFLRQQRGEQLAFVKDGKVVPQIVVGLPAFD